MEMLTALRESASLELDSDSDEMTLWSRYQLLGLCHKTLRVLDIPHFAGILLNPGVGYIPDLNDYLP